MLFIINLILGFGLLTSGRKLFWLFVAAAGFFAGVELTSRFWHGPDWLAIVVGIVLGILFAVLAIALKSIAIGIAGFLLGGSALVSLAGSLGFEHATFILYIVGGVLGVILITAFFDWALIIISSFAGASMILQILDLSRSMAGLTFAVLFIIGIIIQLSEKRKETKKNG